MRQRRGRVSGALKREHWLREEKLLQKTKGGRSSSGIASSFTGENPKEILQAGGSKVGNLNHRANLAQRTLKTAMCGTIKQTSGTKAQEETKIKLYKSMAISTLLYGCETWVTTSRQNRRINVEEMRFLRDGILIMRAYHLNIQLGRGLAMPDHGTHALTHAHTHKARFGGGGGEDER
ncbi:Uncharacterized protein GBIM_13326 [Gryllus bimaculatus]|nr:Uncharacterized protein GBIM_13326 [Gryllus bimaculatus]